MHQVEGRSRVHVPGTCANQYCSAPVAPDFLWCLEHHDAYLHRLLGHRPDRDAQLRGMRQEIKEWLERLRAKARKRGDSQGGHSE